jgi:hypothetical protein
LLNDLFSANEEGLFGVHNLHIYECKKVVKLIFRMGHDKNVFIAK